MIPNKVEKKIEKKKKKQKMGRERGSGKCIQFAASALHVIVRLDCTVAPAKSTRWGSAPLAKQSCHRVLKWLLVETPRRWSSPMLVHAYAESPVL
jgi:hypothetical protein